MDVADELRKVIDGALSLNGRASKFSRQTPLLGAIPELDSMAVVSLITGIEEQFDISIDDGDIDGTTFATFGSLTDFISGRLACR